MQYFSRIPNFALLLVQDDIEIWFGLSFIVVLAMWVMLLSVWDCTPPHFTRLALVSWNIAVRCGDRSPFYCGAMAMLVLISSPCLYDMRLKHAVAVFLVGYDIVDLSFYGSTRAYPCRYVFRFILCLSGFPSPFGHWNQACCAQMSCSRLPFPCSSVPATVFMPIISLILWSVLSLFPNCPFASSHHTQRFVVGISLIASCDRSQFCFSLLPCTPCEARKLLKW